MSYPYTPSSARLKRFLTEIPSRGVPDKITIKYLSSIGYGSKNDRPLIQILKFINLLNSNGTPNQNYEKFRDEKQKKTLMASLLKKSYSKLFQAFPNAQNETPEALKNWFRTEMGVGEGAAGQAARTFNALCGFSNFDIVVPDGEVIKKIDRVPIAKEIIKEPEQSVVINLNIQLALPATENVEVYDKIFKSLKKNILGQGK